MRIPEQEIREQLYKILIKYDFRKEKARILAKIFTESSLDGVYSHGLGRFPRFIQYVKDGFVRVDADPEKKGVYGHIERWNGNLGPGILNAVHCMNRAIEIAESAGIGCIALSNTNHWMRGGSYGWQAAEKGYIGICWTNTAPNMVVWGGQEPVLGNNPLVIGIPRPDGHIVLDMAMSQFSYGKIESYATKGEQLPFPGGWNNNGELTTDPEVLLSNGRSLSIGYWKGSGLSFVLDLLASLLSGGDPTCRIGKREEEYGLSQVFIAMSIKWLDPDTIDHLIHDVVHNIKSSQPQIEGEDVLYPGERTLKTRQENQIKGIPINRITWEKILKL